MSTSDPARVRAQQRIEELCAASLRALSGERTLSYRGHRVHRGRRPLPLYAPHLHPVPGADDFGSFRGAADGVALRLLHSDAALHARMTPTTPVARLVFEMLEQFRVESLADAALPGVAHNLRHRFEQWSLGFHRSRLTEGARGLLLYTLAQIARSRLSGDPVLDETEDLIETMRAQLAPAIGSALAGLRRERHDQAAYAPHALAIAQRIHAMISSIDPAAATQSAALVDEDPDAETAAFALLIDVPAPPGDAVHTAAVGASRAWIDGGDAYRIFTREHDRVVPDATTLGRAEQLDAWRTQLEARTAADAVPLARLTHDFKLLLAAPAEDGWDHAQEEGLVDGRRLAQLVASPTERRLFQRVRVAPRADAVLAFLLDCSGSMREHIEPLAALVDVAARALERAGVASEVLGFTTGAWHGGRAVREWQRAGRPRHPGRLNETLHIVFKDADTTWRRARRGIAALLRTDLYRESIDGEAVDWAVARLQQRDEPRKVVVVVSDGCPMDGATALANDAHYLDQHLREVVQRHERQGRVQIVALGVGLDLSAFYSSARALDLAAMNAAAILRELLRLLARRPPR